MTNDKCQMKVCLRHALFKIIIPSLFIISPLWAQEIPVSVKAEQLKYIEDTGLIKASGSVEVKFEKITIYADSLIMDSVSNVATAEGNVRMVASDYQASSSNLTYDASGETSLFRNFSGTTAPAKIKGKLYLRATELKDWRDKMVASSGALSTCGNKPEHYFVAADKVEYFPDDKVIGYNVTMFVGSLPVFWLPYMYYDLSKERQRNWVFGQNAVEGYFVKSSWGYPYGTFYLDLMSKKGTGYGVENPYVLAGLGAGTYYLYHLAEQDTGLSDWVTRIKHQKQITPVTNLTLEQRYNSTYRIPSGRVDQTGFNVALSHKDKANWNIKLDTLADRRAATENYNFSFDQYYQKVSTNYYANYYYSTTSPQWIRASQRLSHSRPLWSDKVQLTAKVNYYNSVAKEGQAGDERLEPEITITGDEKDLSWRLTQNWYIDLDKDAYTGDESFQYLEKQPELSITPKAFNWPLFKVQPTFGYGKYREVRYVPQLARNRDYTAERYQATLNASCAGNLGLGTMAYLNLGLDQFLYSPGDQRYAYRESLDLQSQGATFFKNRLYYSKGLSDGNSPFLFDTLGANYHSLTETMTFYHGSYVSWITSSGFNWRTNKWLDVTTALNLRPSSKLSWDINTGWDIENRLYKDLVNTLGLYPASWFSLKFTTTSNLNTGSLRSGSVLYDLYFLEKQPNQWQLKFDQVFDSTTNDFKVRNVMLVKDLHCWELKYNYSDYRKEFSVIFTLKAMPGEPFGFNPGRGFYYEGFEREFNKYTAPTVIRRY